MLLSGVYDRTVTTLWNTFGYIGGVCTSSAPEHSNDTPGYTMRKYSQPVHLLPPPLYTFARADWVIAARWRDPSGFLTILMGDTSAL